MLTNSEITIYHKSLDENTRLEKWTRFNYKKAWWFKSEGTVQNAGSENADNIRVRVPYKQNNNLDIGNFARGDIILKGRYEKDIQTQQDLPNGEVCNIVSLNNNAFGSEPHIYIGGN